MRYRNAREYILLVIIIVISLVALYRGHLNRSEVSLFFLVSW